MRKKEKEIWKKYEEMNAYEKSIVHNGWFNFYRVRNGICEYLTNNKRENKIIQQILNRERNERIN